MANIVEPRRDTGLVEHDVDVHAMLRQLRHECDILLREKREMETYCDDVERDRMEKDTLVAGLRSDRDQLQRQVQEASAQKQRIHDLECEVTTHKETVLSMRRQQRQNGLQGSSGLSSPCVSNDSGFGDLSPVPSMSIPQTSNNILAGSHGETTSQAIRKEISRVESVLDELVVHFHASVDKEGSRDVSTNDSRENPSDGSSFADGTGLLLRSELEEELKAAQKYIAQLEEDVIAIRERSRQWEDVTNTLEIDVEALTHELKYEREERMRLQDYADELLGMLNGRREHDSANHSAIETPHSADATATHASLSQEAVGTLADEMGFSQTSSAMDPGGTLADEMDEMATVPHGAHTAVPGGVDLVQPCDLKSPAVDATPTLPSPRKSLAVPDNLRELIYSKPIQLPVCTRLSDLMTIPDESHTAADTHSMTSSNTDTAPFQSTPVHRPPPAGRRQRHPDVSMSPIATCRTPEVGAPRCAAVAVYAFKARDPEVELCVEKGDLVVVLHGEVGDDWWLVKNKSGLRGYVPRDYLDPTDDVALKQEVRRLRQEKLSLKVCETAHKATGTVLIARFDYITCKPKELGFVKGEELTVVSMDADKQWWQAQNAEGTVGFVPVTYLRKLLPSSPGRPTKPPAESIALVHDVGVVSPSKTPRGNTDVDAAQTHHARTSASTSWGESRGTTTAGGSDANPSSTLVAHVGSRLHSLRAAAAGVGGWLRRGRQHQTPATSDQDPPARSASTSPDHHPQRHAAPSPPHSAGDAATDRVARGNRSAPANSTRAGAADTAGKEKDRGTTPDPQADAGGERNTGLNAAPDTEAAAASGTSWLNALSSRRVWSSVEQGVGKTKQRLLQKWSTTAASSPTKAATRASDATHAPNRVVVPAHDTTHDQENVPPGSKESSGHARILARENTDAGDAGPSWMAMALARAEKQKRTTTSPTSDVGLTYDI